MNSFKHILTFILAFNLFSCTQSQSVYLNQLPEELTEVEVSEKSNKVEISANLACFCNGITYRINAQNKTLEIFNYCDNFNTEASNTYSCYNIENINIENTIYNLECRNGEVFILEIKKINESLFLIKNSNSNEGKYFIDMKFINEVTITDCGDFDG